MRRLDIEIWARHVVDNLTNNRKVEDDRVEVKREWPEPKSAARRIAGHANSLRGEDILWIIGADEDKGLVTGFSSAPDPATWWPQVQRYFDEESPGLSHIYLEIDKKQIAALHFDTKGFPFVVKDHTGKQTFQREVPWREGTAPRSARRSELLLLLYRKDQEARFQVSDAALLVVNTDHDLRWTFQADVYAKVPADTPITFPFHDAAVAISIPNVAPHLTFGRPKMFPATRTTLRAERPPLTEVDSLTMKATQAELFLEGSGKFRVTASLVSDSLLSAKFGDRIDASIEMKAALTDIVYRVDAPLLDMPAEPGSMKWGLAGRTSLL